MAEDMAPDRRTEMPVRQRDPSALAGTPPAFRRVEIAALVAFPFAALWLLARTWSALESPWLAVIALAVGFLFADFGSGCVHWFFDTWFLPETRYVGRAFVRTFREHHVDPTAICRHDFVETNGSNALVGGIIVAVGHLVESAADATFAAATLLVVGVLTSFTSQIHQWAHAPRVPRLVRWLQRSRLILSPEAHADHHAAPFERAYCISSGWLNDSLHRLGLFRGIERVVHATTGAIPRRDDLGLEATVALVGDQRATSASQPMPSVIVTTVVGTPTRK